MPGDERRPDEQRRRLFRQMELLFVVLPPLIAVAVAAAAGALLAWLFPVGGTTFGRRWAVVTAALIFFPAVAYGARMAWYRLRGRDPLE